MKVYGHLRDQHFVEMSQKVTFSKSPTIDVPEKTEHKAI